MVAQLLAKKPIRTIGGNRKSFFAQLRSIVGKFCWSSDDILKISFKPPIIQINDTKFFYFFKLFYTKCLMYYLVCCEGPLATRVLRHLHHDFCHFSSKRDQIVLWIVPPKKYRFKQFSYIGVYKFRIVIRTHFSNSISASFLTAWKSWIFSEISFCWTWSIASRTSFRVWASPESTVSSVIPVTPLKTSYNSFNQYYLR